MGSCSRFGYSVLGDAVNLASRLEGQSKQCGVSIAIGEETVDRAPDIAAPELDLIAVKGKGEAAAFSSRRPNSFRQASAASVRRCTTCVATPHH